MMMMSAPIPIRERRFFTPAEVAKELSVSVDTIRRMIRRGEIGFVEVSPRKRRIPREALDILARKGLRRGEAAW
jgi:excisionase family DNA binding protein